LSFLDILHCLPRAVGVPLESALNLVSPMSPCGAHDTHACGAHDTHACCQNARMAFLGRNTPTPLLSEFMAQVDATIVEAVCRHGTGGGHVD